jgi:hypothetical protein
MVPATTILHYPWSARYDHHLTAVLLLLLLLLRQGVGSVC